MKKTVWFTFVLILALSMISCGAPDAEDIPSAQIPSSQNADEMQAPEPTPTQTPMQTPEPTPTPQPYPYEDAQGRTRYQLIINGETVQTDNLPFSLDGEKGAYYPLEDVLNCFGVTCLVNDNSRSATGRVNGQVFTAQARLVEMTVGESTLNGEVTPHYVDGCLYVPSYLFMELLDATVDFTADRSGATLVTDIVIDSDGSTTEGLSLADNTFGDGSVALALSAEEKSGCAKLFLAESTGKGEEVMSVFIDPEKSVTMHFSAGTYILKLAYGDVWISDEEAFGDAGTYSSTEVYTFEAGGEYEIASSSTDGDFYSDSQSSFTGNK